MDTDIRAQVTGARQWYNLTAANFSHRYEGQGRVS